MGKHVHLSFWFSASVYIYLLTYCGQHITPLPGNVRKRNNKPAEHGIHLYVQQHVQPDMYTVTIAHYKKGERNMHKKLVSLIPPLQSEHVQSSIPCAQYLCFWSRQRCTALLDGSPDESFGSGFSTGKKPGPQREVRKRNSNPRSLGRGDRLLIRGLSIHGGLYAQSGLWGLVLKPKTQEGKRKGREDEGWEEEGLMGQ